MKQDSIISFSDAVNATREIQQYFFVPFEGDHQMEQLSTLVDDIDPSLKQPVEAFISAINAIRSTVSIPFQLASSKVSALHYQRIHMAENLRFMPRKYAPPGTQPTEEEAKRLARESADNKFREYKDSDEGMNAIVKDISDVLMDSLSNPDVNCSAGELLYQSIISLWSAFEVLVRDLLTIHVNNNPGLSEKLLKNHEANRYFALPKLSVNELSLHGYDLSNKMGYMIFNSRDFSDIRATKSALLALFNSKEIADSLRVDDLWILNQDRHLIVHRRGVVDQKYIESTGSNLKVGDAISISPKRLERYLDVTIECATSIVSRFVEK